MPATTSGALLVWLRILGSIRPDAMDRSARRRVRFMPDIVSGVRERTITPFLRLTMQSRSDVLRAVPESFSFVPVSPRCVGDRLDLLLSAFASWLETAVRTKCGLR